MWVETALSTEPNSIVTHELPREGADVDPGVVCKQQTGVFDGLMVRLDQSEEQPRDLQLCPRICTEALAAS